MFSSESSAASTACNEQKRETEARCIKIINQYRETKYSTSVERLEFPHQADSVHSGEERRATGSDHNVLHLREDFLVRVKTTKFNRSSEKEKEGGIMGKKVLKK
jgi:hypothetical protein